MIYCQTPLLLEPNLNIQPAKIYKPTPSFPQNDPEILKHPDDFDEITESFTINPDSQLLPETLSLTDKEKEMIRAALIKYKGKRKPAAIELGISERTLYRKIKEYDLEDL